MKNFSSLIAGSAFACLCAISTNVKAQTVNLTQGSMTIETGNTFACNDGQVTLANNFLRSFKISDYLTCNNFHIDSVAFGVDQSISVNGYQVLNVNLYSLPAGSALTYANLTPLASLSGTLYDVSQSEIVTVPFSNDINGANSLVVEIASPDGTNDHIFLMGSNTLPQTKPSYVSAPMCSFTDITDLSTTGTPTVNSLAISVYGHQFELAVPDTFTTGKTMVCAGDDVTYTVPSVSGMSYNWSYTGTGATITPNNNAAFVSFSSTATSGVLKVATTDGSAVSVPRSLNVTVSPVPVPTISRGGNVLTSSIATGCTWYKDNIAITGANSGTYTMTGNGSYFVKVTQNGCTGTSETVQITDISGTAINNVDPKAIGLVISPNPTTDILNVQCKIPVNLSVFSADGKQILSAKDAKKIDMRSFNAGMYYVLFTTEDGTQLTREKFVKL